MRDRISEVARDRLALLYGPVMIAWFLARVLLEPLPRCRDVCPWAPRERCHRGPTHPADIGHRSKSGETWHDWDPADLRPIH